MTDSLTTLMQAKEQRFTSLFNELAPSGTKLPEILENPRDLSIIFAVGTSQVQYRAVMGKALAVSLHVGTPAHNNRGEDGLPTRARDCKTF
jgi:hypothetical protein